MGDYGGFGLWGTMAILSCEGLCRFWGVGDYDDFGCGGLCARDCGTRWHSHSSRRFPRDPPMKGRWPTPALPDVFAVTAPGWVDSGARRRTNENNGVSVWGLRPDICSLLGASSATRAPSSELSSDLVSLFCIRAPAEI